MVTSTRAAAAFVVLLIAGPAVAQQDHEEAAPAAPPEGWTMAWDQHPQLEWRGKVRIEFRARIDLDDRASQAAIAKDDEPVDVPRRRVGVEGVVGRQFEFKLESEIDKIDPLRAAFVNYRRLRVAEIQAGQFKLPFGLEETTGNDKLDFAYRSLMSNRLAPGRDVGVMVHGRLAHKVVGYELGLFANDGDNARSKNVARIFGGETLAGRVTFAPFARSKSALSDLEFGGAFTRSALPEGYSGVRGKTVFGVHFFDGDQWVNGVRRREGAQVRWRQGRLAMAAEYMRLTDDRHGEGMLGEDLVPLVASGWYVSGAWVVAGASSYKKMADPRRPLFGGGFGAIEVSARIERLGFGSAAGPDEPSLSPRAATVLGSADTAETIGAKWRLNRWLTVEGAVIHEQVSSDANTPEALMRAWSRVLRLQVEM